MASAYKQLEVNFYLQHIKELVESCKEFHDTQRFNNLGVGSPCVLECCKLFIGNSQNIVWGGIAGCMPVLIGWAAITNSLSLTAWLFFLLIFFWTPPHFWALAIKYKEDYAAAGIPMLPVVASIKSVQKQMWFHSICMVITSVLVLISAHLPWWSYVITALLSIGFATQLLKISGH